jgi:hypothetical protein
MYDVSVSGKLWDSQQERKKERKKERNDHNTHLPVLARGLRRLVLRIAGGALLATLLRLL